MRAGEYVNMGGERRNLCSGHQASLYILSETKD